MTSWMDGSDYKHADNIYFVVMLIQMIM